MKLALSSQITEIDAFCQSALGIPTQLLMKKSGAAVAKVIRQRVPVGSVIAILAGKGNNGGDGYATACELLNEYKIKVFDIFSEGQRTDEGKYFYNLFLSMGGDIQNYNASKESLSFIKNSGAIVDAIFGTGFQGEVPEDLRSLAIAIRESVCSYKIAVDVPLGINADNGSVSDFAISVDATVELSLIKPGIISYPARSYVGDVIYDSLDIPLNSIYEKFIFKYNMINEKEAMTCLPLREMNSNKSSFGKLLVITGSKKYRGAAHLSVEGALRGGVGYVNYVGAEELVSELSMKFPEVIYKKHSPLDSLSEEEINEIVKLSAGMNATLVGSGSDNTKGLLNLTLALLRSEGSVLILDADAINALAESGEEGREAIKKSTRPLILTPHPLEFSRLAGCDVAYVQQNRIELAEKFASEYGVTLVLKGAGTVVADKFNVVINTTGSSALAKAGSGDVLAGFLSALAAQGFSPMRAASMAVAFHALAGDSLSKEYSSYGVTPSDLPREIAHLMALAEKNSNIHPV